MNSDKGIDMARYRVHVFCPECCREHPMPINMTLDDGPAEKQNINDAYRGKAMPPGLTTLSNNTMTCPETGKDFVQGNNDDIFLVPIGD
jgi:hypothetical protein